MNQNIGELTLFHGSPYTMEIGTLINPGYSVPDYGAQAFATTNLEMATRYAMGLPPRGGATQVPKDYEKTDFNPIYVVVPKNKETVVNRTVIDRSVFSCSDGFIIKSVYCWVKPFELLPLPARLLRRPNIEIFEYIKFNNLIIYKDLPI